MPRTIFQTAYDNNWVETEGLLLTGISPNIQNTQPTGILSRTLCNTLWYTKNPGFPLAGLLATATLGYVALPLWAFATFGITLTEHNRIKNLGNRQLGKRIYSTVGWTPLHFAAAGNSIKVAQGLIFNNADISINAEDERTFITIAKELGHTEFLEAIQNAIYQHIESLENIELATNYLATLETLKKLLPQPPSQTHTPYDIGDDGSDEHIEREEEEEEEEEELDKNINETQQTATQQSTLRHRVTSTRTSKTKLSV